MRNYELVFIVHPELEEAAFNDVLEKVQGWITDGGGKVTNVDLWGKRDLAYLIQNQNEGQYVVLQTTMDPTFVTQLEGNFRFLEPVMRHLIILK